MTNLRALGKLYVPKTPQNESHFNTLWFMLKTYLKSADEEALAICSLVFSQTEESLQVFLDVDIIDEVLDPVELEDLEDEIKAKRKRLTQMQSFCIDYEKKNNRYVLLYQHLA